MNLYRVNHLDSLVREEARRWNTVRLTRRCSCRHRPSSRFLTAKMRGVQKVSTMFFLLSGFLYVVLIKKLYFSVL
jgi:hypothetical protein